MEEIKSESNQVVKYWLGKLKNSTYLSPLNIVEDFPGMPQEIMTLETSFPSDLSEVLLKTTKGKDFNIYKLGLTNVFILLGKYSNRPDIMVTSTALQFDNSLIGSNALIFPSVAFAPESNARNLLKALHVELQENIAYQEYDYADFAQSFIYGTNHHKLAFNIGFIYDQINCSNEDILQSDLLFRISRRQDSFKLITSFNHLKYTKNIVSLISNHFITALTILCKNIDIPLNEINFFGDYDQKLLATFNDTQVEFIEDSVIRQFENQAKIRPQDICIKSEDTILSYDQLNRKGNQIAHHLIHQCHLKKGEKVSLMVNRSELIITGIVGILKAGGVYIPIDLSSPKERIQFFLEDSESRVVLTENSLLKKTEHSESISYVAIDTLDNVYEENPILPLQHQDLAYMIYTSGTTGKPKGAMVYHRSLANHVSWFRRQFGLTEKDSSMLLNSYSFDGCYSYIWAILTSGGLLHIPKDSFFDPEKVLTYIKKEKVTFLKVVPSTFGVLVNSKAFDRDPTACQSIRIIKQGGESINVKNLKKYIQFYPDIVLGNHYGATECTIGSVAHWVDKDSIHDFEKQPVVGSPFDNQEVLILDKNSQILPIGVPGEICIGGIGVGKGYHNRAELTAKKFINHPISPNEKIYRTGDKGRWLPNGTIEFYGRLDNQVKIRGYRIELDEIAETLKLHQQIIDAIALVYKDAGEDQLIAYLVLANPLEIEEILHFLKERLPAYMLPTLLVPIEEIPLTPNGKVDKRSLPDPKDYQLRRTKPVVEATNQVQATLVRIWQELLSKDTISIDDNFFELGGHSLRATQLSALIHQEFNVKIPLREIFFNPTIRVLATFIEEGEQQIFSEITPIPEQPFYPLSHAQKRLWILSKMEEEVTVYNIPHVVKLVGPLNIESFEKTLISLIERHEILRTIFIEQQQIPYQKVLALHEVDFRLQITDLRHQANKMEAASLLFDKESTTVFDLEKGPLLKARLVILEEEEYLFLFTLHHIISDGSSNQVFVKDILTLYQAFEEGRENPLPPLNIHYKDYAAWQHDMLSSENAKSHKDYWLNLFSGELPVLNLPLDFDRPKILDFKGDAQSLSLSNDLKEKLNAFALKNNSSIFMVLLAAIKSLLYHYTRQDDIIIGSPIAGREHADLKDQIGFYVNTLGIRTKFSGDWTFEQLVLQIKENLLDAYEHQIYPFDQLIEDLNLERNTNRSPLFDVLVVMQNTDEEEIELFEKNKLAVGSLEELNSEHSTSKFDLSFSFSEQADGLYLDAEYKTDLFLPSRIERMLAHLKNIIIHISDNPGCSIDDLNLLTAAEKTEISHFCGVVKPVPQEMTIQGIFREQALLFPDHIAICDAHCTYSYRELDALTSSLAYLLKNDYQLSAEEVIPIIMEKQTVFVVAMLALLKAGCAYLPIERKTPANRIARLLEHTSARFALINHESDSAQLPENIRVLNINTLKEKSTHLTQTYSHQGHSSNLAYVMYTSGSTGEPKGVMVEHKSIIRLVKNTNYIQISPEDVVLQTGSLSFDAATLEIWGPLLNGGKVYLLELLDLLDASQLKQHIIDHQVSIMWFTVSWFNHLAEKDPTMFRPLRHLLFGGEKASPKHVHLVKQQCQNLIMTNGYGPTENTTFSSCKQVDPSFKGESLSIGYPISGSCVYILDPKMNLVPKGVQGEIYLGGEGLSRGYINNETLTRESFVSNPFRQGEFLYKSGDLGYWKENGEIEIAGRVDDQLKIRGYRIEPGEVAKAMETHPEVNQAVVTIHSKENDDKFLAGYFTASTSILAEDMKIYLEKLLPPYMLPSSILQISAIPLNKNGKVNKSALPEPQILLGKYVSPANEVEQKLKEIWMDLLGLSDHEVSTVANFFELGGHSLKATKLLGLIKTYWDTRISLAQIFATPTIKGLAEYILVNNSEKAFSPILSQPLTLDHYPLSAPQNRIFILQHFDQNSVAYNMPFIFQLNKNYTREEIQEAVLILIARHESLRTSFDFTVNNPTQTIHQSIDFELEVFQEISVDQVMEKFVRPFDLSHAPLFRVGYLTDKNKQLSLIIDIHHIITDGASQGLLEKELMALLEKETLPKVKNQYRDYLQWLDLEEQQNKSKAQEDFWLSVFEDDLPLLDLPLDFARPEIQRFDGASVNFSLSQEEIATLRILVKENGVTTYLALLAIWTVLLSKLANQEDITVGTPVSGRRHPDLDHIVGMFVNTLSLRNYPVGTKPFTVFLAEVKNNFLQAYEHQEYPFEKLVEKIWDNKIKGRNPIFDTMFGLLNGEENVTNPEQKSEQEVASFHHKKGVAKFDLSLTAIDYGNQLHLNLEYCTQLFNPQTIEKIIAYFRQIIISLKDNAYAPILDIDILSGKERKQLLIDFNNTSKAYPKHKTIVNLLEEQWHKTPDKLAVAFKAETLTYRQLHEQSNQVAHYLRKKGVTTSSMVAICMEHCTDLVISILGIVKAGAAYVPIDPVYPTKRINFILKDTNVGIVISNNNYQSLFEKSPSLQILLTEEVKEAIGKEPVHCLEFGLNADNLIYVIYTSGSTGTPKGVMIKHGNLLNYLLDAVERYRKGFDAFNFPLFTSLSFDLTQTSVFLPLITGGQLFIEQEQNLADTLNKIINNAQINSIKLTPSHVELLDQEVKGTLSCAILGGEKLKKHHVQILNSTNPGIAIFNEYGPTETTIGCTVFEVKDAEAPILIGRPIANTQIYITGKTQRVVPIGVTGEICIGGEGVSNGYLNREELTAEKFIANPFNAEKSPLLYKTGDLGQFLADSNIELIGRKDTQVKLRGYRIELEEIESTISQYHAVNQCAVIVRNDTQGNQQLVAYLLTKAGFDKSSLQEYLLDHLPAYMVPALFLELEELPLTTNGKINKQALQQLDPVVSENHVYVPPSNEMEETLATIWQTVLNIKQISVHDNFFELGGHSLVAIIILNQIFKQTNTKLDLSTLYKNPTIFEMAQMMHMHSDQTQYYSSLVAAPEKAYYPLSPAQYRMFILQHFNEGVTAYNTPAIIALDKVYSKEEIERVLSILVDRHESLRTTFDFKEGEPVQMIKRTLKFQIETLSDVGPDDALKSFIKPFDLSQAPLFRVGYLQQEDSLLLILDMHHIITDDMSQEILEKELTILLDGGELPAMNLQYKDYAYWLSHDNQQDQLKKQKAFWLDIFAKEVPLLEFPTDYPRPEMQNFAGATAIFALSKEDATLIREISANAGATVYMTLLSIWSIFLSKITNQDDIIVGTPTVGRTHPELGNIVGIFVNSLPIRNKPSGNKRFYHFLEEVKNNFLQAFNNQEYPLEKLVEDVWDNRIKGRNPLFDTMLAFVHTEKAFDRNQHNTGITFIEDQGMTKFDLSLTALDHGNDLGFNLAYSTKLYRRETIEKFINYFQSLISSLRQAAHLTISDMEILSIHEKRQILTDFNSTDFSHPEDKTVVELFEEQVEKTPDKIAVVFEKTQLTYQELNDRSNQLAAYLTNKGSNKGATVAIFVERSPEMVISLLAVLKSGGNYLPIDPEYPSERINYMIADSNATWIITNNALISAIDVEYAVRIIDLDSEKSQIEKEAKENLNIAIENQNLAYVIYTSGSTGKPKGILIEHGALADYTLTFQKYFSVCEQDKIIQQSSISFDTIVEEVYPALVSGATVFIVKQGGRDVMTIRDLIQEDGITILSTTPLVLNWLNETLVDTCNLRWVISGGELLQPRHIDNLFNRVQIANTYGPSETTVCATYHIIESLNSASLIGKPIPNKRVYIIGMDKQILPVGIAGELCINGKGLARGYLNNELLTQEKFVTLTINGQDKAIYKTGDWGRWLPDGNIEFLGRMDHQVKINGYRIELGEVEAILQQSPLVKQCLVLAKEISPGNKQLVAYIVTESVFDKINIQKFLSQHLPSYMIPSIFIEMEEIPLLSSGKIDSKALPEIKDSFLLQEYVAPKNKIETQLTSIWQEVLYTDKISIQANFFDLGGHSILSMKMIGKIKETFNISLSIRDLVENPTIEKLAIILSSKINAQSLLFPMNKIIPGQPDIFLIPPILGSSIIYYPLASLFEEQNFNCYGLQYRGFDYDEAFDNSIVKMAQSFFKEIDHLIPNKDKPICVLGYSMGVTIAFELVQILEKNGYSCKLIMLDKNVSPKRTINSQAIKTLFERKKDLKKVLKLHLGHTDLNFSKEDENRINRLLEHNNKIINKHKIKNKAKVNASILAIEAEKSTSKSRMRDWETHTNGKLIHRYVISNHYEILESTFLPDIVELSSKFIENENSLPVGKPKASMTLFNLFRSRSIFFFPFLGLLGIINGVWGSALLIVINNKISNIPLPFYDQYDWIIYVGLIIVSFSVAAFFQAYMIRLTYNFGNELGLSIFNKLRFSKYEDYLKLGEERVRTALEDVAVLQRFPNSFIEGFNAAIMIIVGILYLFWIYSTGALFVSISLIILASIYIIRNIQIDKDLNEARDLGNIYHKNVVDFLRGFKELKMNIKRSDNIFKKYLTRNRYNFVKLQIKSITRALTNELLGIYAWYIMIGIVLFLLPTVLDLSIGVRTSFLVTLLFLMGPINAIIGLMDEFIRMRIALNRLGKFDEVVNSSMTIMEGHGDLTNINANFESIRFEDITYEYYDKNKSSTFKLKPINIEIQKGEIIFVTGGNGSGKSTFINILSGLYMPKSGQIYLNDISITQENASFYRDQLSCIFTDNYLFNENYDDLDLRRSNKTFYQLLEKMKLTHAITFDNENNRVSHTLSKGQQKRIALIYSMLQERDVFIFDEWAAEQDPGFRKFFYTSIIPELKQLGKTVIAVTHDDIYFDCAERLIKFDYGEIVKDEKR